MVADINRRLLPDANNLERVGVVIVGMVKSGCGNSGHGQEWVW